MGKKDQGEDLDKDSRKRLEKLDAQWSEPLSSWSLDKITLADLRLLLEHFKPLQDLIRAIAALPEGATPAALAQETTALREHLSEAEVAQGAAEAELIQVQRELEQARDQCRAVQQDLSECTDTTRKLLQAKGELEQANRKLERELQQAQKELGVCRAQLARACSAPGDLAFLRGDAELLQRLELTELPDHDQQALIQVVAVLAQRDNLERLWQALRERCEGQNRAVSEAERALLCSALTWFNHNWRTRPYTLIEATPRGAYDFERHLRSRQTPTGEMVGELRLPGIADGSGKPLCKALVSTH